MAKIAYVELIVREGATIEEVREELSSECWDRRMDTQILSIRQVSIHERV